MSSYIEKLFSLNGKTALITGGTRGIGANMALALAKAGADVILVQRNESNTETRDKIRAAGKRCEIAVCDLANATDVKGLVKRVTSPKSEGGMGETLDILVNCGGIQRRTPAENFPDQDWDEVLQVNLHTCFTLARDAGRHMLESRGGISGEDPKSEGAADSNPRGRGKIINVASLVSFQGGLTVPAYAAAKVTCPALQHGILGMTKALSNEWVSKGVNINAIAPGYISTEMNSALIANPTRSRQILERIPAGRWGKPEDFEGLTVFLASGASDYISGECVVCDGGWMAR